MTASRTRWVISLLAIAGTVPYLTLKVLWLLGSRIGLHDPDFGRSATMMAANAATLLLELAAVGLALAFVMPFGRRLPGWIMLLPLWVGSGLLGQLVLVVALQLVLGNGDAGGAESTGPIAAWVFLVVYAGFTWLAIFLLAGAVLYANDRWGRPLGWREPLGGWPVAAADRRPALVAIVGLAVGALALVLRASGPFGPPAANVIGDLLVTAAAAGGVWLLATGALPRLPRYVPVLLAWVGTAAVTVWGLYLLLVLAVPNDLVDADTKGWQDVAGEAVRLGSGVLATAVAARLLFRRSRAVRPAGVGAPSVASS